MTHRCTAFAALLASVCFAHTEPLSLSSSNGAILFHLTTDPSGHLAYSVTDRGRTRLLSARAGVTVEGVDLGASVEIGDPQTRRLFEVFPWRGNKSQATNVCLASEIPLRCRANGHNFEWTIEVRVFDDGVGFRYRVPGKGRRRVNGEATCWRLPRNATVWFQTDTSAYEGAYHSARADQLPLEETVRNRKRPIYLGPPITGVFDDGTFCLISEAALFRYSGLTLRPGGDAVLHAAFQDDPNGWTHEGPIVSPWRVLILSRDLDGLVNSDVIPALCNPPDPELFPDGMNTDWLQPGKAPCTWMVFGNDGAQWDRQKWFVDQAAAIGCEYLLVDAGWRTERWGWMKKGGDLWSRAAELCRYAKERNVGIVLWHAYPEGRNDSPGLTTVEAREELFSHCQQAGVKGVKIDFFNSESKAVVEAYEDLLRRAARHHLMIDFHGAHKPTGEPRTWPNEITREGIREQEYLLWGALPLEHYGALPFTRVAVGHADFLPGYVQPRFLKNTTLAFQIASVVVFSSPFLCWPDNPEAYLNSPLLHFVRTVPVTWDETRVLPGSILGEAVVMARRKGTDWYLAVLNCRPEPREFEIDITPLDVAALELTTYREGSVRTSCQVEAGLKPPADGRLKLSLPAGGGHLARFSPPREYPGWR